MLKENPKKRRWTSNEDEQLRAAVTRAEASGEPNWRQVAQEALAGGRSSEACWQRWESVLKQGLRKGPWTKDEDQVVRTVVERMGGADSVQWSEVATHVPGRQGKQVRERWQNHLDPSLTKASWSEGDDMLLYSLQAMLGNKWTEIARAFGGRSENQVKNRWNSKQRKLNSGERSPGGGDQPTAPPTSPVAVPGAPAFGAGEGKENVALVGQGACTAVCDGTRTVANQESSRAFLTSKINFSKALRAASHGDTDIEEASKALLHIHTSPLQGDTLEFFPVPTTPLEASCT